MTSTELESKSTSSESNSTSSPSTLLLVLTALAAFLLHDEVDTAASALHFSRPSTIIRPAAPSEPWSAPLLNFETLNFDGTYESYRAIVPCFRHEYRVNGPQTSHALGILDNCGSKEYNIADSKKAQDFFNSLLYPQECVRHAEIKAYHPGGFGASMHFARGSFLRAIAGGATVSYERGSGSQSFLWGPPDCVDGSPACWFEQISNCSRELIGGASEIEVPYPPLPESIPWSKVEWEAPPKSWSFERAHAMRYLMRPKQEVRDFVEDAAQALFQGPALPRPLAAIFLRGGDKVQESPVFTVDDHFSLLEPLAELLNIKHVYFNSDEEEPLREAFRKFGSRFTLHIPHPDFTPTIPTFFSFRNFTAIGATSRARERDVTDQVKATLADVFIQAHADVYVGALSSNHARLVDELRLSAGKDAFPFLDVDGRYLIEGTRRRLSRN